MLYYDPQYLHIQEYRELSHHESSQFCLPLSIDGKNAHSLSMSPLGGILIKKKYVPENLSSFINEAKGNLSQKGVNQLSINLAPDYYADFAREEEVTELGFQRISVEWNQFVNLSEPITLHEMEKRKLKKSEGLNFQHESSESLCEVHKFISKCRTQQGLEINIDLDKLVRLWTAFPDHYECYAIRKDNRIVSAVIMVLPTSDICYYYLPATDQDFRHLSPMVLLLNQLYEKYTQRGFKIMDLGLSSINGKKQEGLFEFKKRMGATAVKRPKLVLEI